MMQTPTDKFSEQWPGPQRFPQFLDKMGSMMSEDYDWSVDIVKLPMPVPLIFADNDSISQKHFAELSALLCGGVKAPPTALIARILSASSAILFESLFLKALTEGLRMIRPGPVDICRKMMVRCSVTYGVAR